MAAKNGGNILLQRAFSQPPARLYHNIMMFVSATPTQRLWNYSLLKTCKIGVSAMAREFKKEAKNPLLASCRSKMYLGDAGTEWVVRPRPKRPQRGRGQTRSATGRAAAACVRACLAQLRTQGWGARNTIEVLDNNNPHRSRTHRRAVALAEARG